MIGENALNVLAEEVRSHDRRAREWHPAAFLLGFGFSITLLMSWFLEPTRSIWMLIDEKVFWILNDSLAGGRTWQVFWAAANSRAADVAAAVCIVGLFVHFARHNKRDRINSVTALFVMLLGLGITGSQIGKALEVNRQSGTMIHTGTQRLTELVPWIPTKDVSGDSFPGDHATVLLIVVGLVTYYLPRRYAVAAWVIAIVFTAPRVVGGAHWLTDDLVGSVAIAGCVLSCVLATPLHRIITGSLERLFDRIGARRRKRSGDPAGT